MLNEVQNSIFKTLVYADIFDYPLRPGEIFQYLIAKKRIAKDYVLKLLEKIEPDESRISTDGEFYFLCGRGKLSDLRKKRQWWSREKIKKAKSVADLVKMVPTVKLVGISGALAMENSDEDDDIDLFIVAASGRLWLTRFLATILVEVTGQRRRPRASLANSSTSEESHSTPFGRSGPPSEVFPWLARPSAVISGQSAAIGDYKDKICLNMFVDEDHLVLPQDEQNLFTAHEVVQMKPIWERDDTYQKFLWENRWVKEYLPNSMEKAKSLPYRQAGKKQKARLAVGQAKIQCKIKKRNILDSLEKLLGNLQLKYMARRRTTEKIENGRIMFYPIDKGKWVMKNYELKM